MSASIEKLFPHPLTTLAKARSSTDSFLVPLGRNVGFACFRAIGSMRPGDLETFELECVIPAAFVSDTVPIARDALLSIGMAKTMQRALAPPPASADSTQSPQEEGV